MVKYRYDAWGKCKVLNATGTEITDATHIGILNPFRYRSYYYDTETKLYFLKTRYYDPEIGRFITIDDLSYLDPETVNGLNLYAYCANNPVNRIDPTGCIWWNPFSWDWEGMFNSIKNAFSVTGQWLYQNVLCPVGSFFANNWDIIVGVGLVIAGVVIGIMSFGAMTLIAGVIAGAVFGGAFGALNAAVGGGDILQGALTGILVGALGGISGWAAAAGAAGMSFLNDRANGKPRGWDTVFRAAISAFTAGTFAGIGNGVSSYVNQGIMENVVKSVSAITFGFISSSHNFVSDAIINRLSPF